MKITNYRDFKISLEYYKAKYPESYTTEEEIVKTLNSDYRGTGGSDLLGISVSSDNENRCYGFRFVTDNPYPVYEYTGLTKC